MANGLVAGQTSSSDDGSCWAVMDPASSTTEMLWRTCDYSLGAFSPDGRLMLASDPYLDGLGTRSVSILEAQTGDLVATYQQDRRSQIAMTQTMWESDDTVLAIAIEGNTWTMLRMDTAGDLQEANDQVTGDPYSDVPFWFASMG